MGDIITVIISVCNHNLLLLIRGHFRNYGSSPKHLVSLTKRKNSQVGEMILCCILNYNGYYFCYISHFQNKGYVIGNLPELAMAHNKFARLVNR